MNTPTTFTDTTGHKWSLRITVDTAIRVKNELVDNNGNPLDLFAIAERGELSLIKADYQNLTRLIFFICLPEILKNFDVNQWDKSQAGMYELYPEQADESITQKAARWFGSRLDGNAVAEAINALGRALIDFFPDAQLREHQLKYLEAEKQAKTAILDTVTEKLIKNLAKPRGRSSKSSQAS